MRGLAAVAVALIVSGASSAASGPRSAVFRPTSSIAVKGYSRIVADGRNAAAVSYCGVVQWTAGQRKGSFTKACRPLGGLDGTGADEFALAGNRLAWLREESASHELVVQTELVVKTGSSRPREIASAYNEYGDGGWLLGLAGGGDTLAVGWTFDTLDEQNVSSTTSACTASRRPPRARRRARTRTGSCRTRRPRASASTPAFPAGSR